MSDPSSKAPESFVSSELDPAQDSPKDNPQLSVGDVLSMGLFLFLLLVVTFLGWNLVQALLAKVG